MKNFLFLFLFVLSYSSDGTVLTVGDNDFSVYDFFSRYPKKQWERADSLQKEKMVDDFIRRELCILEARRLGFQNNPDVAVKIYNRSLQFLVNESYEYFVARPLLPDKDLVMARTNAKREVFVNHILIGHADSYLRNPPQRTLDGALVLSQKIKNEFDGGETFAVLAEKYSDDPGVGGNVGEVGWVGWGSTVPEFQVVAFSLERGILSSPVLTSFGYHLILVSDSRNSDFQYMDDDAYENLIINITKNSIRPLLGPAAVEYDQKMIEDYGVVFNMDVVRKIVAAYNHYQKEGSLSMEGGPFSFIDAVGSPVLVCVYNKRGYGSRWFSRRLDRTPSSRQPRFETEDAVLSTFKTFILQDIAINKGLREGVDSSYSYQWKVDDMVSSLLYDAYLQHLVNVVPGPDSLSVKEYYENNKNEKYLEEEKITIMEINVSSKDLADSLLVVVRSGYSFSSLAQQYGASGDLLNGPFSRKQGKKSFDVAALLGEGGISPVVSFSNGRFSIIRLVERFPSLPLGLESVYARIESLLIKDGQQRSKKEGVEALFGVYGVEKKTALLY